ncbi:MAG TPA: glutamate 5-kinase [Abditibacteriaceae bacterium]|nr:glutamate 5-kinase [Abditibacteriaceae bacterium]
MSDEPTLSPSLTLRVRFDMKTIVVKIGTSTIIRDGAVDEEYVGQVACQVAALREERYRVAIVTSGAIRVGLDTIGRERAVRLPEKQAAAAIGQSLLMRTYRRAFSQTDMHVAQVLLTRSDVADRRRFLNARHTMAQLFKWGVVPVVNENDTVATEEIRFGDNDSLAALTALVAEADQVLLLSDIDGFYLPGASRPVPVVERITKAMEEAAGGAGSTAGTGGMRTKIEAARIATHAGIELVIAHGRTENVIQRVARGEALGTRFAPRAALRGRKRWIAFSRHAQGTLVLNDSARAALTGKGASLLPIGIAEVEGHFEPGALVTVRDRHGEFARGLSNYSSDDLRRIAGAHSSKISAVLGRADFKEAIHRDNLTLTDADSHLERIKP